MFESKETSTDAMPLELTPEMADGFKQQQYYMLKLLHRTLSVEWENDPDIRNKIEKLSHILAASRWERTRRHAS